jgi:predicted lactoylglutathione lyase
MWRMNSLPNRSLLALVVVHAAASLLHFVHNATFLADYPNMPGWITPGGVYAVWLGEVAIGAAGVVLLLRRRMIGLALIAIYAALGFGGLDHYTLASISAHTLAMNATIWLETATGIVLLVFVIRSIQWSRRASCLLAIATLSLSQLVSSAATAQQNHSGWRDPQPARAGMVAFRARSWKEVDDFHAAALAHGGKSDGAPGLRLHYNPDFYAAYVRDPDGNKICALCRGVTERD